MVPAIEFELESLGTRVFDDIVETIPGIQGDSKKGSLRFTYGEDTTAAPLIMSRTYNDTPDGTFGQFVSAVPVVENQKDYLLLTGLAENLYSRTNLNLANLSSQWAGGIIIRVINDHGEFIGDPVEVSVLPNSTTQIVKLAERAGIYTDLDIYSLYIYTNDHAVSASVSVVDNVTGDPVHLESVGKLGEKYWVPGVAHLDGANNSVWRSDITFFNDTVDWMSTRVKYISPENAQIGFTPSFTMETASLNAAFFSDILGDTMLPSGVQSRGYLVVTTHDESPLPQTVGKTYNVDEHGGTFGQVLKTFSDDDLIHEGESGYIPGVSNSSDKDTGFRTNVGVLNTSDQDTAVMDIIIYDEQGNRAGSIIQGLTVAPGVFVQENVFVYAYLANTKMNGSIEIEVRSGGPIAVYGSLIDNKTQDAILVPASVVAQ